jgi:type IV pilus assembly protein PilE
MGFTLIELMITLVIVSVLVAIAMPSYYSKVLKSHRVEAKTALLDLAGREERYYNTASPPAYTAVPVNLGYGNGAATFPMTVGSGYYTVNISNVSATTYTITATSTGTQTKDTPCATFTLTNTGVQSSSPNTTDCW